MRSSSRSRTKPIDEEFPQLLKKISHLLRGIDQNGIFHGPALKDFVKDENKIAYLACIKQPMDFDTIDNKVAMKQYVAPQQLTVFPDNKPSKKTTKQLTILLLHAGT